MRTWLVSFGTICALEKEQAAQRGGLTLQRFNGSTGHSRLREIVRATFVLRYRFGRVKHKQEAIHNRRGAHAKLRLTCQFPSRLRPRQRRWPRRNRAIASVVPECRCVSP